jgi:hypothetical protein
LKDANKPSVLFLTRTSRKRFNHRDHEDHRENLLEISVDSVLSVVIIFLHKKQEFH